jgi:hypothetical protein
MLKILRVFFIGILLFLISFSYNINANAADTSQPTAPTTAASNNPKNDGKAGTPEFDPRNPKYTDDTKLKEFTTCDLKSIKKSVKIWDLGKVNQFLPIIPKDCAIDKDGDIKPLTIAIIPDLIIRVLGLLFSLAFWLVPLWIVVYGFFIIALPFDGGINTQSTVSVATIGKKAAEKAIELVAGIVLISISFTIVMTVLRLIGLDNGSVNTDLSSFFTL